MRRIYVDLDDVLAQTGLMFLRVLERDFGRSIDFDSIRSYHLGDSFRLDDAELGEFMHRSHLPEALASIEPMPGASEALGDWQANGYEIFVVTGRPPETREPTLDWLGQHGMPFSEFYFLDKLSQYYEGIHGSPDGALSLADLPALDFCLAVEDFPGITDHLTRELNVPVALLDRPWNRHVENPSPQDAARIVRCGDWAEIQKYFPTP